MAAKKPAPIRIKPAKQGSYTARAKAKGHTVAQQAAADLKPSSKASPAVKKQANFARNSRQWGK